MYKMNKDRVRLAEKCYDLIGPRYNDWARNARLTEKRKYLNIIRKSIQEGDSLLDLGCGAGQNFQRADYENNRITGVDISEGQIDEAKRLNPEGDFIRADIADLDFIRSGFNAITAMYSMIHLPLLLQEEVIGKIYNWLKPGGLFAGSFGWGEEEEYLEDDFFGESLWFFRYGRNRYREIFNSAGFRIDHFTCEEDNEFGKPVTFLWIVAGKRL